MTASPEACDFTVFLKDPDMVLESDEIRALTWKGDGWISVFRHDGKVRYYPPARVKMVEREYPDDYTQTYE